MRCCRRFFIRHNVVAVFDWRSGAICCRHWSHCSAESGPSARAESASGQVTATRMVRHKTMNGQPLVSWAGFHLDSGAVGWITPLNRPFAQTIPPEWCRGLLACLFNIRRLEQIWPKTSRPRLRKNDPHPNPITSDDRFSASMHPEGCSVQNRHEIPPCRR